MELNKDCECGLNNYTCEFRISAEHPCDNDKAVCECGISYTIETDGVSYELIKDE